MERTNVPVSRGLGRGLGALIPETTASPKDRVVEVAVSALEANPFQPRRVFDDQALQDLAASLRVHGVLQPLIVRTVPSGYQIVAGERRWRAAQVAGLSTVPAIVRPIEDARLREIALVENLQRSDLNAIEEAEAMRALMEDHHWGHEEVAAAVGRSRPAVTNALRLLDLPVSVQRLVEDGSLSAGHARALVARGAAAEALAQQVVAKGLSVRETEALAKRQNEGTRRNAPVRMSSLESKIMERLGTPVRIHHGRQGGRIEIRYTDDGELERLLVDLLGSDWLED